MVAYLPKQSNVFNGYALLAAAAAMIIASVVELIPNAFSIDRGWADSALWFMIGLLIFALIKIGSTQLQKKATGILGSVTVVTIALTLHNIPEGTASIAAASADLNTGLATGIAIGLQNIPEGLSIAALALAAGHSRVQTFVLVAVSVVAEIMGAGTIWLNQSLLNSEINSHLLLIVAAIMLAISFVELVPDGLRLIFKKEPMKKAPVRGQR